MKRSTDRILTTFAGSLVRPPDLCDLVLEREAGNSVDEPQLERDLRNFRAALDSVHSAEAFLPAATSGMVAYTQINQYYPTIGAYLDALADALRVEYAAIVNAGFLLQLDAPDIPIGRNVVFAGDGVDFGARDSAEYRTRVELLTAACNRGARWDPTRTVAEDVAWAKLRTLRAGADLVSERLWG